MMDILESQRPDPRSSATFVAVDHISFTLQEGEKIFGFFLVPTGREKSKPAIKDAQPTILNPTSGEG